MRASAITDRTQKLIFKLFFIVQDILYKFLCKSRQQIIKEIEDDVNDNDNDFEQTRQIYFNSKWNVIIIIFSSHSHAPHGWNLGEVDDELFERHVCKNNSFSFLFDI